MARFQVSELHPVLVGLMPPKCSWKAFMVWLQTCVLFHQGLPQLVGYTTAHANYALVAVFREESWFEVLLLKPSLQSYDFGMKERMVTKHPECELIVQTLITAGINAKETWSPMISKLKVRIPHPLLAEYLISQKQHHPETLLNLIEGLEDLDEMSESEVEV
jgi:hypothetical protein